MADWTTVTKYAEYKGIPRQQVVTAVHRHYLSGVKMKNGIMCIPLTRRNMEWSPRKKSGRKTLEEKVLFRIRTGKPEYIKRFIADLKMALKYPARGLDDGLRMEIFKELDKLS